MSTWQEIEPHLSKVNTTDYARGSYSDEADRKARASIRRLVLDLERKADERDTLRSMLLEQGAENARLSVELEHLRVERGLMDAWQDAAAAASGPEPATGVPNAAGVDAGSGEAS